MKKFSPLWILLATLIVFAGCKKDEPGPDDTTPTTPTNSVFTFYKAGATWTYDTYDSDPGSPHINQTYTINSINAQKYANVTWEIGWGYTITQEWFADDTKFSMLCSQGGGTMLVFCDANPTVGEKWGEAFPDTVGFINDSCSIVALNETVTVPAGTFTDCIKILETTDQDPIYYKYIWLSLAHGVIKTEGTTTEDYPTIIYEDLSSHN
ncbi:MAG: hypothetical protein A2W93_07935 [Bacteroidetes bacterium GWF2_43_63]|nr:MAG: hypothetical protein A2W94_04590 [Bacteroidetes bacterium GWE2_42_42]OFY55545.1 MAG: hypothetical protein A2W93_07935 [Bacteroidetes bacterium GWF2_43_63]HBG71555.1 hypothetical protein [Bacteroidales bacterium]HCB62088.1 hypothetical protein [Bacteroidales bacterium]HCY22316.1 hypothetical protein [Bacteroidales bacterium]